MLAIYMLTLGSAGMAQAASPATPTVEAKHCVVVIAPRTAEDKAAHRSSRVEKQGCFATLEEKNKALATWVGPEGTQSQYLLIRFWQDVNQGGGAPLEFFSGTGCAGDYGVDYLGDYGWNDIASSAEPYCGRTMNLWENAYQTGASLYMGSYIANLGALNDRVTSWDTAN